MWACWCEIKMGIFLSILLVTMATRDANMVSYFSVYTVAKDVSHINMINTSMYPVILYTVFRRNTMSCILEYCYRRSVCVCSSVHVCVGVPHEKFLSQIHHCFTISQMVTDTANITIVDTGGHPWDFDWHIYIWPWPIQMSKARSCISTVNISLTVTDMANSLLDYYHKLVSHWLSIGIFMFDLGPF